MGKDAKVVFDCEVSIKNFTDKETKEVKEYFDLTLQVDETPIRLQVRKEDKSLLKHLVKDYFE